MLGELMRRGARAVLDLRTQKTDRGAQEVDAAIEAIEQAVLQIRLDFGMEEPAIAPPALAHFACGSGVPRKDVANSATTVVDRTSNVSN